MYSHGLPFVAMPLQKCMCARARCCLKKFKKVRLYVHDMSHSACSGPRTFVCVDVLYVFAGKNS